MRKAFAVALVALVAAQSFAAAKLPYKRGTNCRYLDDYPYTTTQGSGWNQNKTYYYSLTNTFPEIRAKGFDHVRLSIRMEKYYDSANDCLSTSGDYNITNIDLVLNRIIDAGLYVQLLQGYWNFGSNVDDVAAKEKYKRCWQLFAERYKDWPDKLAFELLNEPKMTEDDKVAAINGIFKETIAVIRQSNPTRLILWPLSNSSTPGSISKSGWVDLPEDHSNIAIVAHCYAPMSFTSQYRHVPLDDAARLELRWDFGSLRTFVEAHPDIPVVVNEFGVMLKTSTPSDAHEWLSTVREFCEASGIPWAHFEYTDFTESNLQLAIRGGITGESTWRTNVVDALFPKGWDDQPSTYGQLDTSAFSKKLQVSFTGYAGSEALADFPVLVKLSTAIPGFSYSDFKKANGGDLRFADSTGKHIAHEIDTWNPNGVSTVWVRVPILTAATKIYACYGCANPPAVTAMDVWNDDYVGVWHLGESGLPMNESSRRSVRFTQRGGLGLSFAAPGVVGGSVAFDGGMSNALIAVDHDNLDKNTKYTFEAWTKQSEHKANVGILCKCRDYNVLQAYFLTDSGSGTRLSLSRGGYSLSSETDLYEASVDGSWRHQVCTLDTKSNTGNVKGYLNGVLEGTHSVTNSKFYTGAGYLVLGNTMPGGKNSAFNGSIDEVRISKCVRSADWIQATHDTVAKANFATYSFGDAPAPEPERVLYVPVAAGVTNTLDAALVTSYITNIVKQGAGTLVASAIPDYTGDFRVEGGVLDVGVKNGAGKNGYANTIYVGDGGSLGFSGQEGYILDGKKLVFEGAAASGAPGNGKFFNAGAWVSIGRNMSFTLKSDAVFANACKQRMIVKSADVDLGGHILTLACAPGNQIEFTASTFRNPGGIVVDQGMVFVQEPGQSAFESPASGTASITLMNYATYNGKGQASASGWTIVATNTGATVCGNATRFPEDGVNSSWNGKILFGAKNAMLANYAGGSGATIVSNTVFNAKGPISGGAGGKLSVGPGWLNLHTSDNTYAGAVTVTGKTPATSKPDHPVLAGGGGIGLWNGAACFPNASSVTFTNTARLAFMDSTVCTVPNVKFVTLAGETQSISGGVYTARSTIAGIVKEGAGTLVVDSPAQITGLADIQAGTLKIAYSAPVDATQEGVLAPQPQFASLKFASGTTFDLSDNVGFVIVDLDGSPNVTNSGLFGVTGKWTLEDPADKLTVSGQNAMFGGQSAAGCLAFRGATFEIPSDKDAEFVAAAQANGGKIEVARANWVVSQLEGGTVLPLPTASAATNPRWSMEVDGEGHSVMLVLAPVGGYSAWASAKNVSGKPADITKGIANAVRYAFDIDPAKGPAEIGTPIIQVVHDADGNPAVQTRDLAEGRSDVTFGILATTDLTDWSKATLVPMENTSKDGLWKPVSSKKSGYVYPSQMFFKYSIEVMK